MNRTGRGSVKLVVLAVLAAGAALAITALLVNIFERHQEAKNVFFRVVELTDQTEDPAEWGKNFPFQFDAYRRTVDQVRTRFGGSEAVPQNSASISEMKSSFLVREAERTPENVGEAPGDSRSEPFLGTW